MDSKSPQLINLTKDSLIQLAIEMLSTKYPEFKFNADDYDITAWSNSKQTVVKFRRIIHFTPLDKKNKHLRYDFEVDLSNLRISPFDTWGMENFYIPTPEEQEKIDSVVQAFGLPRLSFKNSIVEDVDMYSIHVSNKAAFGKYFIDKVTGEECMGSIESSYIQRPIIPGLVNEDPLEEIRE